MVDNFVDGVDRYASIQPYAVGMNMQRPLQAAESTFGRLSLPRNQVSPMPVGRSSKNRKGRHSLPVCFLCKKDQLLAVKPRPTTSLVSMTEMMAWGSWVRTIRRMVATSTVLAMM